MKKCIYITAVLIIVLLAVMVIINKQQKPEETGELKIVTTLFPLYDSAKHIAGENAEVSLLLPPGTEAHSFEPKPSDIIKINKADIFVYTGDFMEAWTKDLLKGVDNKHLIVVNASVGADLINGDEEHEKEEQKDNHVGIDPHIWLDFENTGVISDNIYKAIVASDTENTETYSNNLEKYKNELKNIDGEYRERLSKCETNNIVHAGHFVFGYLAKKYDLNYISIQGFSPDSEPTAKDMAGIIDTIKNNKAKYVFFEEMVNPQTANSLAKETGVRLLALHGAHNISKTELENGTTFIDIMKNNLINLQTGLGCK